MNRQQIKRPLLHVAGETGGRYEPVRLKGEGASCTCNVLRWSVEMGFQTWEGEERMGLKQVQKRPVKLFGRLPTIVYNG